MAPCTLQELIRTPHVPELSLAAWTDQQAQDSLPDCLSSDMHMCGFTPDNGAGIPAEGSVVRSTKEVPRKLTEGHFAQIDLLCRFEEASPKNTARGTSAQL